MQRRYVMYQLCAMNLASQCVEVLKIQISIHYASSALMRLYYILIGIGIFFPSGQNFYFRFEMSKKMG